MYFLRRLRPLEVAGDRVRSLRVSLNSPVLSAADLPVGPARAVIVVHREARGRMDATVGVRSLRGGELAYWSFDADLTTEADLDVAADAALTFSESLGFLFDEAAIGPGAAAEKAFDAWLAGDSPSTSRASDAGSDFAASSRAKPGAPPAARGDVPELVLDELIVERPLAPALPTPQRPTQRVAPPPAPLPPRTPFAVAVVAPVAAPAPVAAAPAPAAVAPAPVAAPPQKTLSKFRGREAPDAPPAPKASVRQPLARVQLVKRRSPEEERKLLLRKLLTTF